MKDSRSHILQHVSLGLTTLNYFIGLMLKVDAIKDSAEAGSLLIFLNLIVVVVFAVAVLYRGTKLEESVSENDAKLKKQKQIIEEKLRHHMTLTMAPAGETRTARSLTATALQETKEASKSTRGVRRTDSYDKALGLTEGAGGITPFSNPMHRHISKPEQLDQKLPTQGAPQSQATAPATQAAKRAAPGPDRALEALEDAGLATAPKARVAKKSAAVPDRALGALEDAGFRRLR